MTWTTKQHAPAVGTILNFVVAGGFRSGASVVQSSLNQMNGVVCHADLLFCDYGDHDEQDAVRREAHEAYFGPCRAPSRLPEWFTRDGNPYRYLTDVVFDKPKRNESRIGVLLNYDLIGKWELYDLLEERWREGDFCVVNVVRNPIACLVSAKQARKSGVWRESASSPVQGGGSPLPVGLDPEEVVACVRRHISVQGKIRASCKDALEVQYKDLVFKFDSVMSDVFEFLEIPQQKIPRPASRRMRNRSMEERIANYPALMRELPSEARRFLEEDLI
jgi:hypothetical protein